MDLTPQSKYFCVDCGSEKQYNMKYDAYYCELCNKWMEQVCDDKNCEFCSVRPEKPSQADN